MLTCYFQERRLDSARAARTSPCAVYLIRQSIGVSGVVGESGVLGPSTVMRSI